MNKRVIYPNGSGGIVVLIPTGALPIEEVCSKDVPAGVPYKIIDAADIPADRTFRTAWEADFSAPHGYGIGALRWLIAQIDKELADLRICLPTDFSTVPEYADLTEEEVAIVDAAKAVVDNMIADLEKRREALVEQLFQSEGVRE